MDLYLVLYVPVQLLKFFRKKIWYHLKAQAASSQQASQAIRYKSSVHTKYKIQNNGEATFYYGPYKCFDGNENESGQL